VIEAREVEHSKFESRFKPSGISVSVRNAVIDTARGISYFECCVLFLPRFRRSRAEP
jgi:hypothetical protein